MEANSAGNAFSVVGVADGVEADGGVDFLRLVGCRVGLTDLLFFVGAAVWNGDGTKVDSTSP